MGTITPVNPSVVSQVVTPSTPSASDSIPCLAYREVMLIIRTAATNTYQCTVNDPNTQAPPGTLASPFDPDVTSGVVAVSTVRVMKLSCARFRDNNGNIALTSASTFTGTTLEAYGIS